MAAPADASPGPTALTIKPTPIQGPTAVAAGAAAGPATGPTSGPATGPADCQTGRRRCPETGARALAQAGCHSGSAGRAGHRAGPAEPDRGALWRFSTLDGLVEEFQRLDRGPARHDAGRSACCPSRSVFGKFRRVVRDLSVELGKEVILETEGGETEIDKNVLDRLSEPLVHMIRNSVDHGLEDARRNPAGGRQDRSCKARLRLVACQDAGEILIDHSRMTVKGLDLDRIHRKRRSNAGCWPPIGHARARRQLARTDLCAGVFHGRERCPMSRGAAWGWMPS